jgi:hypothetical protein
MAIPPGTELKLVSKAELEQKFDEALEHTLKNLTPRAPFNKPASLALGYPAGARTTFCFFVGADGYDLAHAHQHMTSKGEPVAGRKFHPSGLLVEGAWWHI